jgi:hypothetical protein
MEKQLDKELYAMHNIMHIFDELNDKEMIQRILFWIFKKYEIEVDVSLPANKFINNSNGAKLSSDISIRYDSLADFLSLLSPSTDVERTLAVAYYLQVFIKKEELTSRDIHFELKQLGYPSANITVAISRIINRKPQLMIQLRKEGNSKQAQKVFKVSSMGIRYIQEKLDASVSNGENA